MSTSFSRENSARLIPQTPRGTPWESDEVKGETDEFGRSLAYPSDLVSTNYFYWRRFYPELEEICANQAAILEEANNIHKWIPWPEDHFSKQAPESNTRDWTVFPLLHTFPAFDESKKTWVNSTCAHCPKTAALLRKLPNCTTALFSKLGAQTRLSSHTGWADLANHVLRVHICLDIPDDGPCGLNVDGEIQYHKQGGIIVFDDSKPHCAFNLSEKWSRTVLIIDLQRPPCIPTGTATGQHTPELDSFVDLFK